MLKKIIILLIIGLTSFVYKSTAQVYGIKGGLNLSDCAIDVDGRLYTKPIPGFNLSSTVEFSTVEEFSFETGLGLSTKGYILPVSGGIDTASILTYIEVPLNVKFSFNLGSNKLSLIAGSYLGYAITGHKYYKREGEISRYPIKWSSNEADNELKRLDFGFNLGAEYEFGQLGLGIQYGLGLANYLPSGHVFNSQRNRVLSVYLVYKFDRK